MKKRTTAQNKFNAYKYQALRVIQERVAHFNAMYGYEYRAISVRNQKTRWGSCSKKGNLNFNYRILLLPETARDYIVVHEICHLKEFNHSQEFWRLVERTFPHYRQIRKSLRKYGKGHE